MTEISEHSLTDGGIALIAAPWPMFSRPSIQLGALKAYLLRHTPEVTIFAHHFFLEMAAALGYPVYRLLARETWLAESLYAALLYPDRRQTAQALFLRQAKRFPGLRQHSFDDLTTRVKTVTDNFIQQINWSALDMAGFSICLCQLIASLYMIRQIRAAAPNLPLMAGGAVGGASTAVDLLTVFPEIDLIVLGEGELPLTRLAAHFHSGGGCHDLPDFPGIIHRKTRNPETAQFSQLPDLETLPPPDYSDYFAALAKLPADQRFFPALPVESSRGCWWQAGRKSSGGCAFCNLNAQWQGYRTKSSDQVADEIDRLTDTGRVLSVAFMDNALPPAQSRHTLELLAERGKDLQYFAELRANTSRLVLEQLGSSGMSEVQIGLEALSSNLLRKMNKGATALDNLTVMKHCEALGLKNLANLIFHFPGSDETDVSETLDTIRFARVFRPPRIVYFWLGRHSPVWRQPRKFGLKAVFNHPFYKYLFPADVYRQVRFPIQDYRGDKQVQRRIWRPVDRAVRQWHQDYEQLRRQASAGPILIRQDGGSFLIIRERRISEEPVNHRLEGYSRKIYLFCDLPRPLEEVCQRFAPLPADRIQAFTAMMIDKGLMFKEKGRILSLAVPVSGR
ncbi:MAG: RiPP maturation radical SAM C-methyltransferase [Desulfosudaceae bacterium]